MAINPTLARDDQTSAYFPLPKDGEHFALKRDGIDFECKLPRGHKLTGRGCMFLSSKRIVFISLEKSSRQDFKSFEIQLASLIDAKFNQPIFGANFLSGKAGPSGISTFEPDPAAAALEGIPAPFTLTFNEGGCSTFLRLFYSLLAEQKRDGDDRPVQQALTEGRVQSVAYVDPSDPSVLYVSQPAAAPNSHEQVSFEAEQSPTTAPTFQADDPAEVLILDGRYSGSWAACRILGPGSQPDTYNIHILPTTEFNSVGGFADKDVPDISIVHLRRPGEDRDRPGPCSFGGCIAS